MQKTKKKKEIILCKAAAAVTAVLAVAAFILSGCLLWSHYQNAGLSFSTESGETTVGSYELTVPVTGQKDAYIETFYVSCDEEDKTYELQLQENEWSRYFDAATVVVSETNTVAGDLMNGAKTKVPADGKKHRVAVWLMPSGELAEKEGETATLIVKSTPVNE